MQKERIFQMVAKNMYYAKGPQKKYKFLQRIAKMWVSSKSQSKTCKFRQSIVKIQISSKSRRKTHILSKSPEKNTNFFKGVCKTYKFLPRATRKTQISEKYRKKKKIYIPSGGHERQNEFQQSIAKYENFVNSFRHNVHTLGTPIFSSKLINGIKIILLKFSMKSWIKPCLISERVVCKFRCQ